MSSPQNTLAKIVCADLRESQATGEEYLNLELSLKTPIMLKGEEVDKIFVVASNSPDWNKSYKRAELREALNLEPITYAKVIVMGTPILLVPIFNKKDLRDLLDKDISITIIKEETPWGPRLKVIHFLPSKKNT